MTQRSESVQSSPTVSDERLRNVLKKELHRAINVAPKEYTRASLAEASGVNIHTIDQIMSRDAGKHRRVALEDALSLALEIGERAVNAIFATIGYVGRPADAIDQTRPMRIVANCMGHLAVIGQAAADDEIDHTEEPDTTAAADMLIAELIPLSSAGRKG